MGHIIDITGQKFNKLIVIEKTDQKTSYGEILWLCQCECGNRTFATRSSLIREHTKSCGCLKKEKDSKRINEVIGKQFGHLYVVRKLEISERKNRQRSLLCLCDCGNYVDSNVNMLESSHMVSCGCKLENNKENFKTLNLKYKHSNKRLYSVYKAILERCYNPKQREYHNYGGRGIIVCPEWLGEYGYDVFAEWAFSNGYDPKAKRGQCTIERIDTNGNYEPTNCRWATNDEQQNSRRNNLRYRYKDEVHTISEWAEILKVNKNTLYYGLRKKGKLIEYYIEKYKPSLLKKEL